MLLQTYVKRGILRPVLHMNVTSNHCFVGSFVRVQRRPLDEQAICAHVCVGISVCICGYLVHLAVCANTYVCGIVCVCEKIILCDYAISNAA